MAGVLFTVSYELEMRTICFEVYSVRLGAIVL